MAVVKGYTGPGSSNLSSYAVTSPGNTAAAGATNANGLLLYTPASSTLDGGDFATFFTSAYQDSTVKGVALTAGTYFVSTAFEPTLNFACSLVRT